MKKLYLMLCLCFLLTACATTGQQTASVSLPGQPVTDEEMANAKWPDKKKVTNDLIDSALGALLESLLYGF